MTLTDKLYHALVAITEAYRDVMLSEFETSRNDTPYDTPQYRQAVDAIQEFKVEFDIEEVTP